MNYLSLMILLRTYMAESNNIYSSLDVLVEDIPDGELITACDISKDGADKSIEVEAIRTKDNTIVITKVTEL